jgi:hypothetical protein
MKKTLLLLAAITAWSTIQVSAFYNPSTGRWLSKDPIDEPSFRLLIENKQALPGSIGEESSQKSSLTLRGHAGPNLYGFVSNEPLAYVDPLGLLKFDGCSASQQVQLTSDFNTYCGKLKNSLTGCCKNNTILPKLENICNNNQDYTIKCESAPTGSCAGGTCGWSLAGGKVLHFCPGGWNSPTCGPLGCTTMHEFTHMIGHPFEKWPNQVEKCLGCP